LVANLIQVDSILKEHGIDSEQKLERVPPATLGKWLGVDAVMYGNVTHYEAYYAFMLSAWQVGADVRMVSTHDGEQLFAAYGSRFSVNLQPAWDPIDIAINSVLGLLQLRDVVLARAEEEDAREIVLRIPRAPGLEHQLIEEATDGTIEDARDPAPAAAGN
ncbi:MAG TPA: GNA1162 family protein, partial [Candidatus Binataceae bacterium]|nr:GNA1162 family protein [Candidatus Binataceae bacterium]